MYNSKPMGKDLKPTHNEEADENEFALNLISDVTGISKSQIIRYRDEVDPIPRRVASDLSTITAGIKIFNRNKLANTMQLNDFLKNLIGFIR